MEQSTGLFAQLPDENPDPPKFRHTSVIPEIVVRGTPSRKIRGSFTRKNGEFVYREWLNGFRDVDSAEVLLHDETESPAIIPLEFQIWSTGRRGASGTMADGEPAMRGYSAKAQLATFSANGLINLGLTIWIQPYRCAVSKKYRRVAR